MASLSTEEQDLCARLFDRLVTPIGTKIAYPTEALAAQDMVGPGVGREIVDSVLLRLTLKTARIVKPVLLGGGVAGYELFHDVLGPSVLDWKRSFREQVASQSEFLWVAKEIERLLQATRSGWMDQ